MYTLYTDKQEDFKCKIGVDGADISKTKARLVVEGKNMSYLFEGVVDSDGECTVPVSKLKNVLSENESGRLKLEVIAEDAFFSPWEDDFVVKTSKKVTVEVVQNKNDKTLSETKLGVSVTIPTEQKPHDDIETKMLYETLSMSDHGVTIVKILNGVGITKQNLIENSKLVKTVIKEYASRTNAKFDLNDLSDAIYINLKD